MKNDDSVTIIIPNIELSGEIDENEELIHNINLPQLNKPRTPS